MRDLASIGGEALPANRCPAEESLSATPTVGCPKSAFGAFLEQEGKEGHGSLYPALPSSFAASFLCEQQSVFHFTAGDNQSDNIFSTPGHFTASANAMTTTFEAVRTPSLIASVEAIATAFNNGDDAPNSYYQAPHLLTPTLADYLHLNQQQQQQLLQPQQQQHELTAVMPNSSQVGSHQHPTGVGTPTSLCNYQCMPFAGDSTNRYAAFDATFTSTLPSTQTSTSGPAFNTTASTATTNRRPNSLDLSSTRRRMMTAATSVCSISTATITYSPITISSASSASSSASLGSGGLAKVTTGQRSGVEIVSDGHDPFQFPSSSTATSLTTTRTVTIQPTTEASAAALSFCCRQQSQHHSVADTGGSIFSSDPTTATSYQGNIQNNYRDYNNNTDNKSINNNQQQQPQQQQSTVNCDKFSMDACEIANFLANELFVQQLVSMDCMRTGVPTLTTPTLTPTTLRSIEESFIELTSEPVNAPFQAGFIPPPLGAYNNTSNNNNNNSTGNLSNANNSDNNGIGLNTNSADMLATAVASAASNANNNLHLHHQQQHQNLSNMYLGDISGGGSLNEYGHLNDSETENSQESWNAAQLNEENSLATTDTSSAATDSTSFHNGLCLGGYTMQHSNNSNNLISNNSNAAVGTTITHTATTMAAASTAAKLQHHQQQQQSHIINTMNTSNGSGSGSNSSSNCSSSSGGSGSGGQNSINGVMTGNTGGVGGKSLGTMNMTATGTTTVTPARRGGGRRPATSLNMSPEEEEKRRIRRERNKLAAARCRKRRVDQTNDLTEEVAQLERKREELQKQIEKLHGEKDELKFILEAHLPNCQMIIQLQQQHQHQQPLLSMDDYGTGSRRSGGSSLINTHDTITGIDSSLASTARSISPIDLKPILNDELLTQIKPEPLDSVLECGSLGGGINANNPNLDDVVGNDEMDDDSGIGPTSSKRLLLSINNPMIPPPPALPSVAALSSTFAASSASLNVPLTGGINGGSNHASNSALTPFGALFDSTGSAVVGGNGVNVLNVAASHSALLSGNSTATGGNPLFSAITPLTTISGNNSTPHNTVKQRPNTLPTVPRSHGSNLTLNVESGNKGPPTDINGVAIQTPSTGMFNFDSLMDGGTGLTPVAGPLVPNCTVQNKHPLELVTPTSEPSKIMSL